MSSTAVYIVLTLALTVSVCTAHRVEFERYPIVVDTSSTRVGYGWLVCICSPTSRGSSFGVRTRLRTVLSNAHQVYLVSRIQKGKSHALAFDDASYYALSWFKLFRSLYGFEAIVNADAALRGTYSIALCVYDKLTGKNFYLDRASDGTIRGYASTTSCMSRISTRSRPEYLGEAPENSPGETNEGERSPEPPDQSPIPTPSSTSTPIPTPSPTTSPEKETGIYPALPPSPTGNTSASSPEDGPSDAEAPIPQANEGCVDVRHLQGYVLQHSRHLLRDVLCYGSFCATPNHAIIVNGKLTSTKRLCQAAAWKCSVTKIYVNNLKISANTRARYRDIVITPYDIRYPVALLWFVQMAEDVLQIVVTSICAGCMLATGMLLHEGLNNRYHQALDKELINGEEQRNTQENIKYGDLGARCCVATWEEVTQHSGKPALGVTV